MKKGSYNLFINSIYFLLLFIFSSLQIYSQNNIVPYFIVDDIDKAYSISKAGENYLICGIVVLFG